MRDLLEPPAADLDASPSAKVRAETKIAETIAVALGDARKAETPTPLHARMETTIEVVMAMCSAAIAVDREAVNVVETAAAKEVAREEEPLDMTPKDTTATTTKVRETIAALAEITITITTMNVLRAVEDTMLTMIIPARTTEEVLETQLLLVQEDHLSNTIMIIKVDMRTTGDLSSNKEETITTIADPTRTTPDPPGIIDLALQDLTIKIMMEAMVVAKEAGTMGAREVVSEAIVVEMAALEEASAVAIMQPEEETPVALLERADLNSSSATITALADLVLKTITIETK